MEYLFSILAGFLAGLIPYATICRKLWIIQCDMAATQAQLLKDRNSRAAQIRHTKADELLDLMAKNGQPASAPVQPDPLAKFRRA